MRDLAVKLISRASSAMSNMAMAELVRALNCTNSLKRKWLLAKADVFLRLARSFTDLGMRLRYGA